MIKNPKLELDQLSPTADIDPGLVNVTWISRYGIDLIESFGNHHPKFDGLRVMFDRPEFGPAFEIAATGLDELIEALVELQAVRDLLLSRTFKAPDDV